MHDGDRRVAIPGFYDDVLPLSAAERELIGRLPFDEEAWLAEAGHSSAASGEAGYGTLERVWTRSLLRADLLAIMYVLFTGTAKALGRGVPLLRRHGADTGSPERRVYQVRGWGRAHQ